MAPKDKAELIEQLLPVGPGTFSPLQLLKSVTSDLNGSAVPKYGYSMDPSNQLFPETARWSLCALKNLTRPPRDPAAVDAVLDAQILPLILRIVTVRTVSSLQGFASIDDARSSSTDTPVAVPPEDLSDYKSSPSFRSSPPLTLSMSATKEDMNAPRTWGANSIQDAALFMLLHLAASPEARGQLMHHKAVHILSSIADYGITSGEALRNGGKGSLDMTPEDKLVQQFQCLKAVS